MKVLINHLEKLFNLHATVKSVKFENFVISIVYNISSTTYFFTKWTQLIKSTTQLNLNIE